MKARPAMWLLWLSISLPVLFLALGSCTQLSVFQIWDDLLQDLTPKALELSPSLLSIQVDQEVTISATGGVAPYAFSMLNGEGSLSTIDAATMRYSAPASPTVAIIQLRDAAQVQSTAILVVTAASVEPLRILPSVASLEYGEEIDYVAVGGMAPFWFSIVSGLGTIDESTGLYVAPGGDTDAIVRVDDSSGQSNEATVTVRAALPALVIDPTTLVLEQGSSYTFSAMGGDGTYTFSRTGAGNIDAASGLYSATAVGSATVRVASGLDSADADVTIVATANPTLAIVPASVTLVLGGSAYQFQAVGGEGPYEFSMQQSVGGSITPDGLYTPATGTKLTREYIRLQDSRGISKTATVTLKTK